MSRSGGGGNGGEFTYRQLEQLWLSAGGRRKLAPTMAAIAEAESGGRSSAENPSGATGLWQILGAVRPRDQSRLTNPNVNAREAVLKYQDQGLGAWETYTSGAYKKFMQGGRALANAVHGPRALLDEVEKFDGTPYVWGGDKPGGFDCSGLVFYALQKLGIKGVPRTSEEQWAWSQHVPRSQLKPGDLVFFAGSDGTDASPGHVAVYAGNGQIVQALENGTKVGKFPLASAGVPVGYGRVPGIGKATFTGSGAGGGGGGGGGQIVTTADPVGGIPGLILETITGGLGSISGLAQVMGTFVNNLEQMEHAVAWLFVPSHWMRIGCFLVGVPMTGMGILTMVKGTQPLPVSVGPVSTQVSAGTIAPAVGIAEVTVGAILLFVAFHNLDSNNVHDWPTLISYLQGALQHQGAQPTIGEGEG